MNLNESEAVRLHRYQVMDEVLQVVRELKAKHADLPYGAEVLDELLVRFLESGGLADPTGDPRLLKR
jgi:hypothetical protein